LLTWLALYIKISLSYADAFLLSKNCKMAQLPWWNLTIGRNQTILELPP